MVEVLALKFGIHTFLCNFYLFGSCNCQVGWFLHPNLFYLLLLPSEIH